MGPRRPENGPAQDSTGVCTGTQPLCRPQPLDPSQPSHHLLATGAYHWMRNTGPRRRARERARREPGQRRPPRRRTRRSFGATLGRWSGRERLRALGSEGRGSHRSLGGGGRDYRRGRGRSSRRSDPGAVNGTRPITERGEEDIPGQAARTVEPQAAAITAVVKETRADHGAGRRGLPSQAARTVRPWRSRPRSERPSRSRQGTWCAGPVPARGRASVPITAGTRRPGRARPGGRGAPCAGEQAQESLLGGREKREPHARCAPG